MLSKFTLSAGVDTARVCPIVKQMTGVMVTDHGDGTLTAETVEPFGDEGEYGPRMDRVMNVIRGMDPSATRVDL